MPRVSADAKIPIVPVEFSPPPDVVNRSPLQTEEVPKLVKGERRARTKRTATGSIFGDSIIATAILDRLLHHSTTINIRGESYRLKDRRKAGLVPPRGQEGAEAAARSLASDSVPPKARQKTALGSTPSEAKEAHS